LLLNWCDPSESSKMEQVDNWLDFNLYKLSNDKFYT
jgi:hypothetical protein